MKHATVTVVLALVLLAVGCSGGSTSTTTAPTATGGIVSTATQSTASTTAQFSLYAAVDGDTAASIAQRSGIDVKYLVAANSDLRDGESIAVGQMLIIPSGNGILYPLRYGETLADVAARFGVSVADILNWPGNGITSADQVSENQLVFIPGAVLPVGTPPPTPP